MSEVAAGVRRVAAAPVLEVRDLSVSYAAPGGVVQALRGASLTVAAGQTVALVGESGSGKSSLALAVMRGLDANGRVVGGGIRFQGNDLLALHPRDLQRLRGARMAMVFQDPQSTLNPSLVAGEQVAEVLRAHARLDRAAARARTLELLQQVNLPDPEAVFARYPHELSGGQQQRIVIAMAFACRPELLVMDEPTTGLDVTTEARILDLIAELAARHRAAILYITHNLGVVARFCQRVTVLYAGEVVEEGPVARVFTAPAHPYTRALLACVPRLDWSRRDGALSAIEGRLPDLAAPPRACVFEARCPHAAPECGERKPALEATEGGGRVRCVRWRALPPFAFVASTRDDDAMTLPPRTDSGPLGVAGGAGAATGSAADVAATGVPGSPAGILATSGLKCYYAARPGLRQLLRRLGRIGRPRQPEPARAVRAVDDVSVAVARGATLAVVGESGCGKTTLARAVVGLLEPTEGTIRVDGQDVTGLAAGRPRDARRRVQIVFQNPDATLNPQKTVAATLARPLELFGLARGPARDRRISELLAAVHLPDGYRTRYPHELSGGEKQRVAIARAFAAEPALIVCDEPLSALDVSVQAAVLNLLVDLQRRSATAYLFISHDLSVVRYLADRLAVMYMGRLCEVGTADELFAPPYHPYTEALLSAIPLPDPSVHQRVIRLEGPVPSPLEAGPGCRFHTRCPRKLGALCEREDPPGREVGPGHTIHCHIPLEDLRRIPPVVEYRRPSRA